MRSAQDDLLADGLRLEVVEGHRHPAEQQRIIDRYSGEVLAEHPGVGPDELEILTSRFVSPIAVAPHDERGAERADLVLQGDGVLDLEYGVYGAATSRSGARSRAGAECVSHPSET